MEHRTDRGAAAARRPIGKRGGDVRQRAAAVVTQNVPSEVAENDADGARGAERQTADDRAENAESSIKDAAAAGAMRGKVHAADSMGRLLS